jgi:GNAT superfamily N-acetyltransferase
MFRIEFVNGSEFAVQAASILQQAWTPPAVLYTPEYLRWQLSFPGTVQFPAVAAFDGSQPVGFAGITARRFRLGSIQWDSGILSFVAVLPTFRGKSVAAQLYHKLLSVVRDRGVPVLIFVQRDSSAERTFKRAVSSAQCHLRQAGHYQVYGYLPRPGSLVDGNCYAARAVEAEIIGTLSSAVNHCATDRSTIWSDPSAAQIQHYSRDPRPRELAVLRSRDGTLAGAAWIVQAEFVYSKCVQLVATVESVFLPWDRPEALVEILRLANAEFMAGEQQLVTASNVAGFDPSSLRMVGVRMIPAIPFCGYLCAASIPDCLSDAKCTNVEIV